MSDIASVLTAAKLSKYAVALDAAGYDDLKFLKTRTESQLREVAKSVNMPVGHADRFVFAITKAKTNPPVKAPMPTSSASASSPAAASPAKLEKPPSATESPRTTSAPPVLPEASSAAPVPPRDPGIAECVAICIDHSGSMGGNFQEMKARGENAEKTLTHRSRMDAVKQIFYAFGDRTATLSTARGVHKLGLIKFDHRTNKILDLTDELAKFESIVDDLRSDGGTNIYDAINAGCNMLQPMFESHPTADLRVLVLTDGESCGGSSASSVLPRIYKIGAVVDAIIVGDRPDPNLRRIVTATGGRCFNIRTLSEGFQLMESESVVSLRERRGGTDKPDFVEQPVPNLNLVQMADMILADGSIMEDPRAAAEAARAAQTAKASISRIKRIQKELKKFAAGTGVPSGIHVFPDASVPVDRWKVLLEGPAGSPFEGGVFVLKVDFPSNYPFSAPTITFETPVYHCNTNASGRICLELLYTGWSAATNVSKCLEAIKEMLKNPNKDSPLRDDILKETEAHLSSGGTDTRYIDKAKALTSKEASLSVADWEKKWAVKSSDSIQAGITKATALAKSTSVPKAPAPASRPAPVSTPTVAMQVASIHDVVGKAKGSSTRSKRVLKELKQVTSGDSSVWMHEGKGIHIFPDANDFSSRWKVLLEGPAGSPFEGGVFVLKVDIPSNYPFSAPTITFETPVYHCNASASGRICLELLYSGWSPTLTLPKAIEAVQILLKTPDTDNALRSWIAEETIACRNSAGTETQYLDAAKKLTKEKASVSVEAWKKKWGVIKSG